MQKEKVHKKYSNFKEESYYKKTKNKKYSNKKYQNSSSKKIDKQDIKCFKCNKKWHIPPNCKVKEIVADLDIGKRLKQQMINLIKTESQSDSSCQTLVETSSDDQLLIEDSSSNESSSQSSCDCVENYLSYQTSKCNNK